MLNFWPFAGWYLRRNARRWVFIQREIMSADLFVHVGIAQYLALSGREQRTALRVARQFPITESNWSDAMNKRCDALKEIWFPRMVEAAKPSHGNVPKDSDAQGAGHK